jgi:dTDP-glucose 4,6-dehydratase
MTASVQSSLLSADLAAILLRTDGLWETLRGQTIFLTGGTGFFGRWLLESFVAANRRFDLQATAVVLSREPEIFRLKAGLLADEPALQWVRGDVRTFATADIRAQLGDAAPDTFHSVIHAASETSVAANRDHPLRVLDTMVAGTRRVLDFAAQSGVKNFLLVSSGAVYGEQPAGLSALPENYPGAPDVASPLAAYGEAKRLAELLCHSYARTAGMNCKIARCFAFVGPYLALDAHYAIGNFIRDALAGRTIQIKGDGTPVRSYLYAGDLAAWLWTILLQKDATGAFNVGSPEAFSISEIAETVVRLVPGNLRVAVAQRPDPSQPVRRYVPDVSRARRELGLEVWTPLAQAVQHTLEFHLNQ